ncbi:hypothetical protein NEF87_001174 [Candidatus Lokiarchaeum ossiferum]|uniref:N-acetyltransferase domain-containing protein n=1 Tax=Candidatus Lokiarchaeum ossiferum TaxID=2951803 RepID=A0ABY6HN00_9ARCH|nr:hypothetical protein NEF87_001174 [Candidatus Lokiarchaeum sp. B-35]
MFEQEITPFQDGFVILREYELTTDPDKLVLHLFDKMNSPEGITELRASDKRFAKHRDKNNRFIAEFKGKLIATLTLVSEYWSKQGFHMYSVVTAKDYQGSGITSLLFDYACQWASAQGKSIIIVDTYEDNLPAQKYFKKIGFKRIGIIPDAIENSKNEKVGQIFYYLHINLKN